MQELIIQKIISIPLILIALSGHELAHAIASTKLGDPTPKMSGRLTINPLAHLDLVGTLLMFLAGFGWAKPVMINPQYYKNRKAGTAIVAVAGPLANFIMAAAVLFLYAVYIKISVAFGLKNGNVFMWVSMTAMLFASYNLSLMMFNIIPIPPLDGSKVLGVILPNSLYYKIMQYERYYSMALIIFILILARIGIFDAFISGRVGFIMNGILRLLL